MKRILFLGTTIIALLLISCFDSTSPEVKLNQPTDFAIIQEDLTKFFLTWTDNSKNEDGYRIDRKFDDEDWFTIDFLPESSFSYLDDISLPLRQSWDVVYYRVYAYEDEDVSLPAEGSIAINFPAPTNLTATYINYVLLEWTDNSEGEEGFIIERKKDTEDYQVIAATGPNIDVFVDDNVEADSYYYYQVSAFVGEFQSNASNEVMVSTQANPLLADFEADITNGMSPLDVNFTDLSSGEVQSWAWDFGNGVTSTLQNPLVQYADAGIYTVSLTISDGTHQATETKFDYIVVNDNPNLTLFEDFEGTFLPSGWLNLNPDGGTGWEALQEGTTPIPGWTGGTATACPGGGSYQAFCTWETGGAVSNDQWLITPQFTVQDGDMLSFWMIYYFDSYSDHVEIRLSTTVQNDVNAFDTVIAQIVFPVGSSTQWTQYSYLLSDFVSAGTPVYLAFRENVADNFNDGSAIGLDNVMVANSEISNRLSSFSARTLKSSFQSAPARKTRR